MYKTIFTYFCSFIKIDKSLIVSFPFNIVQESLKTKLENVSINSCYLSYIISVTRVPTTMVPNQNHVPGIWKMK